MISQSLNPIKLCVLNQTRRLLDAALTRFCMLYHTFYPVPLWGLFSAWKLLTQLQYLQTDLDLQRCDDTNGSHQQLIARHGERALFSFHFLAYVTNDQTEQPIRIIGRRVSLGIRDQRLREHFPLLIIDYYIRLK